MDVNDAIVIDRWITERDAEAFRDIVARHGAMVYATCRRILRDATEAEDAAQDCFVLLSTLDHPPGDHLGPWLHKVATYKCLKRIRSGTRRLAREHKAIELLTQKKAVEWDDIYDFVDEAISELPEKYRSPLVAHFLEDETHAAIGERYGLSRQTVTYRIEKAIEIVRKNLRKRGVAVAVLSLSTMLAANLKAEALPLTLGSNLGRLAIAGIARPAHVPAAELAALVSKTAPVVSLVSTTKVAAVALILLALLGGLYWYSSAIPDSRVVVRGFEGGHNNETRAAEDAIPVMAPTEPESTPSEMPSTVAIPKPSGNYTLRVLAKALDSGIEMPLPNATVEAEERIGNEEAFTADPVRTILSQAPTGPDGIAELKSLPAEDFIITARTHDRVGLGVVWDDQLPETKVAAVILRPAGALCGRVIDEEGHPVANALVCPFHRRADPEDRWMLFPTGLRTGTGADGVFLIPQVEQGEWRIAVKAAGYAPLLTPDHIRTDGSSSDLVLHKGGYATGSVVLAKTNAPLAGVRVRIFGTFKIDDSIATTDVEGRFSVMDLALAEYSARTCDNRFFCANGAQRFVVGKDQRAIIPTLIVGDDSVVEGRVFDADTGLGIPDVPIVVHDSDTPLMTDQDGRYQVSGDIGASAKIRVEAIPGYVVVDGQREVNVQLTEGKQVLNVDFAMRRSKSLMGLVVDSTGTPVADALVRLTRDNGAALEKTARNKIGFFVVPPSQTGGLYVFGTSVPEDNERTAQSNSDGSFTFSDLASSCPVFLSSVKNNLQSDVLGPLVPGTSDEIKLVLESLAELPGHVQNLAGRSLANWQVAAVQTGATPVESKPAKTDKDGQFLMTGLPQGEYSIIAAPPGGFFFGRKELARVSVQHKSRMLAVKLVVEPGLSISGTVEGDIGTGSGDLVECIGPVYGCAQTDEQGNYEIFQLVQGLYTVRTLCGNCCTGEHENVPAGSTHVDFRDVVRGSASGRIVDSETGKPVTQFKVAVLDGIVEQIPPEAITRLEEVRSDEGLFGIGGINSGDSTVVARARGYADGVVHVYDLAPTQSAADLIIKLQPVPIVQGCVVNSLGAPVADALLYVGKIPAEAFRGLAAFARSDTDGSFTLETFSAEPSIISCWHPDYGMAYCSFTPGQRGVIALELVGAGNIEGYVTRDGELVSGATIRIYANGSNVALAETRTSYDGHYLFERLPVCKSKVECIIDPHNAPTSRRLLKEVSLESDTTVPVDFDLAASSED